MQIREQLFCVSLRDKEDDRFSSSPDVKAWGRTVDEATRVVTDALCGPDAPYLWRDTGPVRDKRGDCVFRTREVPDAEERSAELARMAERIGKEASEACSKHIRESLRASKSYRGLTLDLTSHR